MATRAFTLLFAAALLATPVRARADWGAGFGFVADESVFYDALSPYGEWVSVPEWGWCWRPTDVPVGWRPYTYGHWAYTDAGYMWLSDYPWGWAPFHYGRWTYDPFYGWVWVPGDVWAPAWVAWRWGDDWCAWAPLPPAAGWNVGFGLGWGGGFDPDRDLPARSWCFVRPRDLFARRVESVALPQWRNASLLPLTRDATRYTSLGGRPVDRGPDIGRFERLTGRAVPRYRVQDVVTAPARSGLRVTGNTIAVYRPNVHGVARHSPPQRMRGPDARIERGRTPSGPGERPRRLGGRPPLGPRRPAGDMGERRPPHGHGVAADQARREQAATAYDLRRREAPAPRVAPPRVQQAPPRFQPAPGPRVQQAPGPRVQPAPRAPARPGPPPDRRGDRRSDGDRQGQGQGGHRHG